MNNVKSRYSAIIAVLLMAVMFAGCQVMRGERSVGQYASDSNITAAVKAKLVQSDEISATRVHVETDRGVVLLSGFVQNKNQALAAQRIALRVAGVRGVKNFLQPASATRSADDYYLSGGKTQ